MIPSPPMKPNPPVIEPGDVVAVTAPGAVPSVLLVKAARPFPDSGWLIVDVSGPRSWNQGPRGVVVVLSRGRRRPEEGAGSEEPGNRAERLEAVVEAIRGLQRACGGTGIAVRTWEPVEALRAALHVAVSDELDETGAYLDALEAIAAARNGTMEERYAAVLAALFAVLSEGDTGAAERSHRRAVATFWRAVDDLRLAWGGGWELLSENQRRGLLALDVVGRMAESGPSAATAGPYLTALARLVLAANLTKT